MSLYFIRRTSADYTSGLSEIEAKADGRATGFWGTSTTSKCSMVSPINPVEIAGSIRHIRIAEPVYLSHTLHNMISKHTYFPVIHVISSFFVFFYDRLVCYLSYSLYRSHNLLWSLYVHKSPFPLHSKTQVKATLPKSPNFNQRKHWICSSF